MTFRAWLSIRRSASTRCAGGVLGSYAPTRAPNLCEKGGGDLKDHGIEYIVEPDPEALESCYVLIERGFLARDTRAA